MKAIVRTKYGINSIQLVDVPKPAIREGEVLVQVRASSVTTHNLVIVSGKPFFIRLTGSGLLKPKITIPGSDLAGQVEAVGRNVNQLHAGDDIFGDVTNAGFGAFAEYVCVPEKILALKPTNLTYTQAAAVPQAALVALQGLRDKGQIQKGQSVLIDGASGGIGTFAIQIAKYFGAEITGVCSSQNIGMLRSLGADHVIDYTKDNLIDRHYDLIFNIKGSRSIFEYRDALNDYGTFVSTGGPSISRIFQEMFLGRLISNNRGKKFITGWVVNLNQEDLIFIKQLIEAGKIKPVIDSTYPLAEAAEALRYYSQGHARGKVVVSMEHGSDLPSR